MKYTIGDFIRNLQSEANIDKIDLQSDEALELLNEYLPRNLMVRRILPEQENIFDSYKMRAKLGKEETIAFGKYDEVKKEAIEFMKVHQD